MIPTVKMPGGRIVRAVFPPRIAQWFGPLVAVTAAAGLIAILVITTGTIDLAASTPHPEGWARLLHYTFERATGHQSGDAVAPANFGSAAEVAKGATYYGMVCAACHGGPGVGQSVVAMSMRPQPQYLVHEVGTLTDKQLFYIVKHGVKYSAMPAWPIQDRNDEVWSIVSFLRQLPNLSTAQFRTLAYGDAAGSAGPVATLANGAPLRPYATGTVQDLPGPSYRFARPAVGFDAFALHGDVTASCGRCHTGGGVGQANGAIPNLTLLDPSYFRNTLGQFAAGNRRSGYMQYVATQLSDAQIAALATYYTAQPRRAVATPAPNPQLLAVGARVVSAGVGSNRQAACANCHGIAGASARGYPSLDGQNLAYLRGRLLQFRTGQQQPGRPINPMLAIARDMTDREVEGASLYYAARAPATRANEVVSRP